jgi:Ca2+-binding RTX toxin-like protein
MCFFNYILLVESNYFTQSEGEFKMATILSTIATSEVDGTNFDDFMLIGTAYNTTIDAMGGKDSIVVGYSVNSVINGGDGNDSMVVLASGPGTTTMIGGIGNDTMVSGLGHYAMYGDAPNIVSPVPLFLFFNQASFTNQVVTFSAPDTGFGDDIMYAGNGGNFMNGDSGSVENDIFFHTSQTGANQHQSMLFELTLSIAHFGNDTMYGGSGNDTINGEADTTGGFTLGVGSTSGSTAIADGINSQATALFYSDKNAFLFGTDKIFGGDGDDVINGDLSVDAFEVAFGVATATNGGQATSILANSADVIIYGNDIVSGGNGNDIIAGDGLINSHQATGGSASADGAGSVARVLDSVGIDVHDHVTHDPLKDISGNDVISGDAGNDTIYGDHKIYYNEAVGGTATAAHGGIAFSSYEVDGSVVIFGNDTISGGAGNDKIVGDVLSTEVEVVAGTANGVGASVSVAFNDFKQIMGDDIITGGSGSDLIVGDCLEYSLPYSGLTVSTASGHVRIADSHNNSITWGNDMMSAGSGVDNFITAVALSTDPAHKLVAQGNDVIQNFSVSNDKLTFVGTDMSTLVNHTSVVSSGNDTIIKFDGGDGGSITLQNVHVNSLSALHVDVLANPSTLMSLFPG